MAMIGLGILTGLAMESLRTFFWRQEILGLGVRAVLTGRPGRIGDDYPFYGECSLIFSIVVPLVGFLFFWGWAASSRQDFWLWLGGAAVCLAWSPGLAGLTMSLTRAVCVWPKAPRPRLGSIEMALLGIFCAGVAAGMVAIIFHISFSPLGPILFLLAIGLFSLPLFFVTRLLSLWRRGQEYGWSGGKEGQARPVAAWKPAHYIGPAITFGGKIGLDERERKKA
jgi:hypothetical protein